jgi:hypothetical protein
MISDKHHHLHKDERDSLTDWVARAMSAAKEGTIRLDMGSQSAVKIEIINSENKIIIDLLQPTLFRTPQDETGLFDKLKKAKEFAHKLTQNGVTLSILRRGKEAIKLGKNARPILSKVITRSSDIEIDSMRQTARLKRDLKAD